MISRSQQTWAFFYRDWQLTRAYWSWVLVFTFYAIVTSATVALIGVAAGDPRLTLTLTIGVLLWSFLSVLFNEISMSIAFERWEGTLEYTFMAPVPRLIHLMGISLYAVTYSLFRVVCVLAGLMLMIDLPFAWSQLPGVLIVLAVSSVAFVGLGLMAAVLPVMSPERGAEATISSRESCCWFPAFTIRWRCCRSGFSRWRGCRRLRMHCGHRGNCWASREAARPP